MKVRAEKGEKFEDLAKQYSDEKETQTFGGLIGKIEVSKIPPGIKEVVDNLADGSISDPIPYNADPTKDAYHIIYKKKSFPEHKADLKNDFHEVEQFSTTFKQNKLYSDWIESLRKSMYWEVKE